MGRRAHRASIAVAAIPIVMAVASCRSATEVVVEVRTNAAYRDGFVVSFTVGTPDEVESAAPTTEQRTAWGPDGFVGSLTVVPGSGSGKDTSLGVKIVLGIDRDSRSCTPPDYRGCIVARRRIHYAPHERLVLPVALYVQCKDNACDATSTCNLLGQCVSATVDPGTCSEEHGCNVSGDPQASASPPPPGAGALDGAASDGSSDAAAPTDGARDAPVDAEPDGATGSGTPGRVDCGAGLTCDLTAGLACCFNLPTQTGTCIMAGVSCADSPSMVYLSCDGPEDCGSGQLCCGAGPTAQCGTNTCAPYPAVCHSTRTCATGTCTKGPFAEGFYETCN